MRFQVPQFIEREAKVVGPLTFRQFVYLAAPGAVAFFLYFVAPLNVFIVGTILLGFVGFTLGFVRMAGKSLPEILLNLLGFTLGPKTYIWKGKRRRSRADALESYQQTQQEEVISGQVKLKKEGLVQNLSKELETKK